jgi:hypothetical protein
MKVGRVKLPSPLNGVPVFDDQRSGLRLPAAQSAAAAEWRIVDRDRIVIRYEFAAGEAGTG